jgi:hypothetical protein
VSRTACVGGTRNAYRILTWKSVCKRHFGVDILWRRCKGGKYGSKDMIYLYIRGYIYTYIYIYI